MNLKLFEIEERASIRSALKMLEANHFGVVFTINSSRQVTGLVTDGDIRRRLLDGGSLEDPIINAANSNFVWTHADASREFLLKKLDQKIQVIPLLDENKKLVNLVTSSYFPINLELAINARARAPVRISFGGGGSDLTHFFKSELGAVLNATISIYSHASLRKRDDDEVHVHSRDLQGSLIAKNLEDALGKVSRFGLLQSLLKVIKPNFGFDLYLHSDFPINSGLGGSATVSAAVLGCFNQFRQDQWGLHEMAELAFQAERLQFQISGGWQDQYASVFGGFNFMEFSAEQNIVHPLRIPSDVLLELEESLILCDTGISHNSGEIHKDQEKKMKNADVYKKVRSNVECTYLLRNYLLRGRLLDFGNMLHKVWELKRQFGDMVSSPKIDMLYEGALKHGAIGGKLLGAGGGGFFLFYVEPFRKFELMNYLKSQGLNLRPFRFDDAGVQAWSVRDNERVMRDV